MNRNRKPWWAIPAVITFLALMQSLLVTSYPGCRTLEWQIKVWGMEYRINKGACLILPIPEQRQIEQKQ